MYVMDASVPTTAADFSRRAGRSPSWSPTGSTLHSLTEAGIFQVFVADVASGQLSANIPGRTRARRGPDSRHIVFQSNRTGRWEIWQTHIDGTGQRQFTRGGGRLPTWAK